MDKSPEEDRTYASLLHSNCKYCFKDLLPNEQVAGVCTWCMFSPPFSTRVVHMPRPIYGNPKKS